MVWPIDALAKSIGQLEPSATLSVHDGDALEWVLGLHLHTVPYQVLWHDLAKVLGAMARDERDHGGDPFLHRFYPGLDRCPSLPSCSLSCV